MKIIALLIVLLLCSIGSGSAITVYVDTDGSGDYNCDGTDDHVQINQALAFVGSNAGYHTVHLNGTNTYWINATLNMYENTIFEGDSNAEIKLIDEAGWATLIPLISNTTAGSNNFTIQGFKIDGNSENQSVSLGAGYYTMMYFENCYNVTVSNMTLEWGTSDGLKVWFKAGYEGYKAYVTFTNNSVYKLGHDVLYVLSLNNVTMANNDVFTRTNSACRLTSSGNAEIYNNTVHSEITGRSTGPGLEIDKNQGAISENISIYNNTFHTLNGAGIWITNEETVDSDVILGRDVHIHHNIFYDVGQYYSDNGYSCCAIVIGQSNNTIIENNVINNCERGGIKYYIRPHYYHIKAPFTTTVRNNIIINTHDDIAAGLWNYNDTYHTFLSDNNCYYNNDGGNYNGTNITYSNDIQVDPLFVLITNHNYYLKSNAGTWNPITSSWNTYSVHSPCIDAGNELSNYDNEPYPNGGRINIGAYGNTIYASKSDTVLSVDNSIKSSTPNSVYSNLPYLHVGQLGSTRYRSWVWFDLSEYAPTEIIDSAVLNMTWYYVSSARNQSTDVGIYFPNVTVDTNYLSWNCSDNDTAWSNPGGDWFDADNVSMGSTPFDNVTFPDAAPDMAQHSWDLTTLVQSIVNSSRTNNGFFIIADEVDTNYIAFSSLDNETEADRPTLTITASNYTRVEFIAPTLSNQSTTNNDYVKINASIELESITLDSFTWNWNGTNTTFLNSSTVLYMSFDNNSAIGETSTVVVDVSQYGNNGSFIDGSTGNWTTDGYNRGAMSFDGVNDSINCGNAESLNITDVISVSGWMKCDGVGLTYIISKNNCWRLQTYLNKIYWYVHGPNVAKTGSIIINDNQWHYIVVTYDNTSMRIFVDSIEDGTGVAASSSISYHIDQLTIGSDFGTSDFYNGTLDEVRVDNRVLSHDEINQSYHSNLYKYNSTYWYFSSNQTNLSEGEYNYQIFANDIESDYKVVTYDITLPTYSNDGHSSTEAGESVTFSIQYNDDIALNPNGQYIFSTNNTGIWVNDSAINWTTTPQYSNVVKTLNSTNGTVVGYRWYASDTGGNINNTLIYTLIVIDTIPLTDIEIFVVPIAAFAAVVFASAVIVSRRVRRGIGGFINRRLRRR